MENKNHSQMKISRYPLIDEISLLKLLVLLLGTPRKKGGNIICILYKYMYNYFMYIYLH